MKKLSLHVGLFLLFSSQLLAQAKSDQALILQRCNDLPGLQSYLTTDSKTFVMTGEVVFQRYLELGKNGNEWSVSKTPLTN